MFSRRKRNNNTENFINKNLIITVVCLVFSFFILYILINHIHTNSKLKLALEKDIALRYSDDSSDTFKLDKIYLYSSSNATNNETNRDLWNLNIFQYTDIALYINSNTDTYTEKNTIKDLYIDNIEFPELEKGTPSLYYKSIFDFGNGQIIDENIINDRLNYELVDSSTKIDTKKATIYNTLQNPITLEYVNKDIKTNAIIPNTNEQLKFDGTLLSKANISLNSIRSTISFNINLINNLNEHYINKITISIPLENENETIYNGFIKKEIINIPNSEFIKTN